MALGARHGVISLRGAGARPAAGPADVRQSSTSVGARGYGLQHLHQRRGSWLDGRGRTPPQHHAGGGRARSALGRLGASLITRAGRTVSVTEEGADLARPRRAARVADLRSVANDRAISGNSGWAPRRPFAHVARRWRGWCGNSCRSTSSSSPVIRPNCTPAGNGSWMRRSCWRRRSWPKTSNWEVLREEPLVVLVPAHMADRDPQLLRNEPLIR